MDHITTGRGVLTEPVYPEIIKMVGICIDHDGERKTVAIVNGKIKDGHL